MVARKKGKLSSSPTPLLPIGFSDSPLLLSHLRLSPKLVKTAPEKDPRKISHSDIPPTELSNNFHLLKCLQNFSANLDLQVYLKKTLSLHSFHELEMILKFLCPGL